MHLGRGPIGLTRQRLELTGYQVASRVRVLRFKGVVDCVPGTQALQSLHFTAS
jgi:hypothetical protein